MLIFTIVIVCILLCAKEDYICNCDTIYTMLYMVLLIDTGERERERERETERERKKEREIESLGRER